MFNQIYYFQTMRKYVSLFGTLFDEIFITKENPSTGHLEQVVKVPVTYAAKEKMLTRVQQEPDLNRGSATPTLPLISFEMTNITYDGSRKLITTNRIVKSATSDPNNLKYQYNPVPYNFGFRLYVYVKNAEDGTKIIEQILPYFTPDFTVSVNLIPDMNVTMDIPIIMNSISQEDSYEGGFAERRAIVWTLDFTLKGYIYGPIKTGAIIKFANTNYYVPNINTNIGDAPGTTPFAYFKEIQPGLTNGGQPTSVANNSISPLLINVTDDYGFVINTTYGI
jgi:hypothetical protein